jgi:hypothetical protein
MSSVRKDSIERQTGDMWYSFVVVGNSCYYSV